MARRFRIQIPPVGRCWRPGGPAALGLPVVVITWWLLLAGTVALTVPAPADSAPTASHGARPGQAYRVNQPGMPSWPIPVDRAAFDEHYRATRESDGHAVMQAIAASEWIDVVHGQAVRVIQVDGEAIQVEILEGPNAGRHGWLKPRHLEP